ncbi:MAG: AAA family ATPase [Candidatus Bathyarchaeia archaeon]
MRTVFSDAGALLHDYVPAQLPHRGAELKRLLHYFEPAVKGMNISVKVHVVGPVGSGKTVLCRRAGLHIMRGAEGRVRFAYVNLAYAHRPYHAVAEVHRQVLGVYPAGLSPEEMIASILDHLVGEDLRLVVALDEVDTYVMEGRSQRILYMLPRCHEVNPKAAGRVSVIYVSRSLDWLKRLDEATLDTIGRTSVIALEKYGFREVRDIVAYRADLAFRPGAIEEDVLDLTAQISMAYGGVRYALELLLEAGMRADYEGSERVKAEHIRLANASIPKGANGALYPEDLDIHAQLLLLAILEALKNRAYITVEDALSSYRILCEQEGITQEEEEALREYVRALAREGYIITQNQRIAVEYPVDKPIQTLRKTIKQKAKSL